MQASKGQMALKQVKANWKRQSLRVDPHKVALQEQNLQMFLKGSLQHINAEDQDWQQCSKVRFDEI